MTTSNQPTRRFAISLALGITLAASLGIATAQSNYPNRPIRLIVPMPPGGGTDAWARLTASKMGEVLGQTVLVDNRPGAGTMIAAEMVARSPADGYTLLIGDVGTYAVNPNLYKKISYDPAKDFAPITLTSRHLLVLAVPSSSAINNAQELIAKAKARPSTLNYGSASVGSPHHLAMELFQKAADIRLNHIPYKGGAPLAMDMIGGQLDVAFMDLPSALPYLKAGKLKGLAIASPKRIDSLPSLQTMAEINFPNYDAQAWQGLVAPVGTPKEVIDKLNAAYAKVSSDTEVRQKLSEIGIETTPSSALEFGAYMKSENVKWGSLIKEKGISAD